MSHSTTIQCGQSLDGMTIITKNYDNVPPFSAKHTKKNQSKDEELILQEQISKASDCVPGRSHNCKKVDRIEPNVTAKVDKTKFFQWHSDIKKEQLKSAKYEDL